jgi:hypothetical protein
MQVLKAQRYKEAPCVVTSLCLFTDSITDIDSGDTVKSEEGKQGA